MSAWRWTSALLLACSTLAQAASLDAKAALQDSEAAIGRQPGDAQLLDREGRVVSLRGYTGKPLLVSFIYTGCFQVCPLTTRALHEAVAAANASLGAGRFNVISVGFNAPADSPAAMKAFAAQQRVGAPNWDFLSAPAGTVEPLVRDFGFAYLPTAAGFDHVLQVSLVDARGRIVRQVYGDQLRPQDVVGPLRHLLENGAPPPRARWADLADRLRLLCTTYDPETGTYRTRYGLALEVAGGLTFIVCVLGFYAAEWRQRRRLARRPA